MGYAGAAEGPGRTEDDLAYLRDEREFTNLQICELGNDDFAVSMARLLIFSSYARELYRAVDRQPRRNPRRRCGQGGQGGGLPRDHVSQWVLRLGDGTEVSHARMQRGLERVWPYVAEMFDDSWLDPALIDRRLAVRPAPCARPQ